MISGASDEELDIAIARSDVLLELQPKIDELKKENQKYKETIDKAIEYIEKNKNQKLYTGEEIFDTYSPATDLLNILEEV